MLLLSLAGCSSDSSDLGDILGKWVLEAVTVNGSTLSLDDVRTTSAADPVPAWFKFDANGRFTGEGPCGNRIRGSYELTNGRLQFADVTTQAGGCPGRDASERAANEQAERTIATGMFSEGALTIKLLDNDEVMKLAGTNTTLTFRRIT